jgi:hypothetical protein
MDTSDSERQLLRHTLATLAYRGGKALRGVPETFVEFRPVPQGRTAGQILAHIGDLLAWGCSIAKGKQEWHDSEALSWQAGTQRFYDALAAFDAVLASDAPLAAPANQLFQGPIADALAHVGQIAMLRRLAGVPMRGENYYRAKIQTGRVGPDQSSPVREFD